MLYLISLGLNDEKDISIKGLEIVKKAKEIYLENYTSKMQVSVKEFEKFYNKSIKVVDRDFVEKQIEKVFEKAKTQDIAILVKGDVYSATTHIDLYLRAKKANIPVKVILGTSIITAIGITGLNLYKFGKTTSIPFNNKNVKSIYETLQTNKKNNLHTLFLLDLDPENNKFLSIKEALGYLKNNGLDENTLVVGCARIGSDNPTIKAGSLKDILNFNFGKPPYCLIVPGKLHFVEEEALSLWK